MQSHKNIPAEIYMNTDSEINEKTNEIDTEKGDAMIRQTLNG
jgi:hypothetical protein